LYFNTVHYSLYCTVAGIFLHRKNNSIIFYKTTNYLWFEILTSEIVHQSLVGRIAVMFFLVLSVVVLLNVNVLMPQKTKRHRRESLHPEVSFASLSLTKEARQVQPKEITLIFQGYRIQCYLCNIIN